MCKNVRVQAQVIERAKRDTPFVLGVYDMFDGVKNLIGLIKVFDQSTASCEHVHRYGDVEPYRNIPIWSNPSKRVQAGWFDLNPWECVIEQV